MKIMTDSPIRFPGLFGDWAFTISSKALDVGNGVYWYGILIAMGMLLALWFCMKRRTRFGIREEDILDGLLFAVPLSVIGARLYYVVFYLDLYQNADGSFNWGKAVAIWDGGLAIYGGVIAAFLSCLLLAWRRKFPVWALTDLVVMGLLIGQAVGRWGNFMNREAFGAETTLPWRMQLTTTTGRLVEVHPTFFYESLWNVIGLVLLVCIVSKARRFDGENTCFYFLWYGTGRFFIEGLRADSLYLFGWQIAGQPVRVSQALSLVMVLGSLAVLVYRLKIRPADPAKRYDRVLEARRAAEEEAASAPEEPVKIPDTFPPRYGADGDDMVDFRVEEDRP